MVRPDNERITQMAMLTETEILNAQKRVAHLINQLVSLDQAFSQHGCPTLGLKASVYDKKSREAFEATNEHFVSPSLPELMGFMLAGAQDLHNRMQRALPKAH